jgi:twitching motility protein PilT
MFDMDHIEVFNQAVEAEASDLIVTAGEPPIVRIHGNIKPLKGYEALTSDETRRFLYGLLRDEQIARFEQEKELDFSIQLRDRRRFRGNAFFQRGAVGAAFRTVPGEVPSMDELFLPSTLGQLALSMQGLMMVTGPTGSGKSTTLASMIDVINRKRRVHVVTIEDPIEYLHTNKRAIIEQREVGEDTLSFPSALRHCLRQSPDVILIGELRDFETISTAVTAAETGHLVLGTLHTNDCVQAVDRMIDVFPPNQQVQIRSQLAASLLAVFNQRLLPRSDQPGLIAASELLIANVAVRTLIREDKTHQLYSVMETGARDGMYTMDQCLKRLFVHGHIPLEEARRRVRNPREFEKFVS